MLSCDERTAGRGSWRFANRSMTHDDLDDKHGTAAAATDEGRRWRCGAFAVDRVGTRRIEQGTRLGQVLLSYCIGQQAVMPYAVETDG